MFSLKDMLHAIVGGAGVQAMQKGNQQIPQMRRELPQALPMKPMMSTNLQPMKRMLGGHGRVQDPTVRPVEGYYPQGDMGGGYTDASNYLQPQFDNGIQGTLRMQAQRQPYGTYGQAADPLGWQQDSSELQKRLRVR